MPENKRRRPVRQLRMHPGQKTDVQQKQQNAADDLDRVADKHDPAFSHGIGKRADKRGEQHVKQYEYEFEYGSEIFGSVQINQQGDCYHQ